jgi:hypothetical protein
MMIECEDWDFWLTLHENRVDFHFIDEILFDYSVVPGSRSSDADKLEDKNTVISYKSMGQIKYKMDLAATL